MAPTSVTSSPSMIQVTPSARITRQCQPPQGSRSMRPGMFVRMSPLPTVEIALMASPSIGVARVASSSLVVLRRRPDRRLGPGPGHRFALGLAAPSPRGRPAVASPLGGAGEPSGPAARLAAIAQQGDAMAGQVPPPFEVAEVGDEALADQAVQVPR